MSRWMRTGRRAPKAIWGALLIAILIGSGQATALVLGADPTASSVTPDGGPPSPITGSLEVAIGQLPPLANTNFDLTDVSLFSSGYAISLQSIAHPGLGVLAPTGDFLIPTLFLTLDDGVTPLDVVLRDVTGLLVSRGGSCVYDHCLSSDFEIDTGAGGLLAVSLYAVPEPSTALLVALGLGGIARKRRRMAR